MSLHILEEGRSTLEQVVVALRSSRELKPLARPLATTSRLTGGGAMDATAVALEQYGAELFGFLIGVLADENLARDVYVQVCQQAISGLAAARGQCSTRSFLYFLARRGLCDLRRRRTLRSTTPENNVENSVRTEPRRLTRLRRAIEAVRRSLSTEERELLILYVDRRLTLYELVVTALGPDGSPFARARERMFLRRRVEALLERVERLTLEHVRSR